MGCTNSTGHVSTFESVRTPEEAVEFVKYRLVECDNVLMEVKQLRRALFRSATVEIPSEHFLGNLYEDIQETHKRVAIKYSEESDRVLWESRE